jgi:hypothetical protein
MSPLHSSHFSSQPSAIGSSLPLFSRFSDKPVALLEPTETEKPSRAIELAVAVGIVVLLIVLLIPTLNSQAIILPAATRGLVDHLRLARAGAASRGAHFRVTFQSRTYAIEQLQDRDGDGIWEPDNTIPAWHVSLPPTVAIGTAANTTIEFDARGLVATRSQDEAATPVKVKLIDSQTEKSAVIEILPSGKVQRS